MTLGSFGGSKVKSVLNKPSVQLFNLDVAARLFLAVVFNTLFVAHTISCELSLMYVVDQQRLSPEGIYSKGERDKRKRAFSRSRKFFVNLVIQLGPVWR